MGKSVIVNVVKTRRVKTDAGKHLEVALNELSGKVAKVGWFEKSKYPKPPNVPVAYVATIQEFGYSPKNIPPRPFMRPTLQKTGLEGGRLGDAGAKAFFKVIETAGPVMKGLG